MSTTNDLRVTAFQALPSPVSLRQALPLSTHAERVVGESRDRIGRILHGDDNRLLVVVGPCSVHDPGAALEYARRLAPLAHRYRDRLEVVMRVYFEKPRSTGGWKGLINDPHLDGSHRVAEGLQMARGLLREILELGLPVGCEFLEPTSPQYIADAVSWGAIGARTTESQIHRQLASGVSMPVGFKNATDGDVQVAVDGCTVARSPHVFFGVDELGRAAVVNTLGNPDGHVILRGGHSGPNYRTEFVEAACALSASAGHASRVVVDASHANSGKDHIRQATVVRELCEQIAGGEPIAGIMMESFLVAGSQKLGTTGPAGLVYGQSITDACMDWETTATLLSALAVASGARQAAPLRGTDEQMAAIAVAV